jgi:hypothetical protein
MCDRAEAIIARRVRLPALLEALEGVQQVARQVEQLASERRGLDAAIPDDGDGAAHGVGELAQHAGDGGLRERQLVGGARHAAQPHAGLEGHQLRQQAVAEIPSQSRLRHGGCSSSILVAIPPRPRRPARSEAAFAPFEAKAAGNRMRGLRRNWQRSR